jgi:two-component system, cell cycle sensor histidine kinase and response regulator CckA
MDKSNILRLLIVEDSEADTYMIVRELQRGGFRPEFERVETAAAMREALQGRTWDLVISDYSMPLFGGPAALALYREKGLEIPFISVSGAIGEETAVEMMKAGAHDYVMKDNLTRLAPAVTREFRAAQERRVKRQAEEAMAHLAAIVQSCDDAIISATPEGKILSWNPGAERLYGYTAVEMIENSEAALLPGTISGVAVPLESASSVESVETFEAVRRRKDGKFVEVLLTVSPIRDGAGQVVAVSSIARSIAQRKEEERVRLKLIEELTEALARVRTLTGLLPICPACKRIRNDQGYWEQVETYVKEHTNAEFTQSICPECAGSFAPEFDSKGA